MLQLYKICNLHAKLNLLSKKLILDNYIYSPFSKNSKRNIKERNINSKINQATLKQIYKGVH